MGSKTFNVAVIGLSGCDEDEQEYKVGKSVFCNSFVRPAFDELYLNHNSIYQEQFIKGKVIRNENFLYWGSSCMRVEGSNSVDFHVIEQTCLRSDNSSSIPLTKYAKQCVQTKLSTSDKYMYICEDQVKDTSNYPQVPMPNSQNFQIDGYIIIYNADPNIKYANVQKEFIKLVIPDLRSLKKPFLIAASKCDLVSKLTDIKDNIFNLLSDLEDYASFSSSIVETSAKCNVNIVSAFQYLYSLSEHKAKTKLKLKNYAEAERSIKNRNEICIDSFVEFCRSKALHIDLAYEEFIELYSKSKIISRALEVCGKEQLRILFNKSTIEKRKIISEKLFQRYLNRFELSLTVLVKELGSFEISDTSFDKFNQYIENHEDFDKYFVVLPEGENWNDPKYITEFCEKIEKKQLDKYFLKVPTQLFNTERFHVILTKHVSKLIEISQHHKIKAELESVLNLLAAEGKITITSTYQDLISLLTSLNYVELSESLADPTFKETFNGVIQRLLLKAKANLHELLFENSKKLDKIKFVSKAQIVEEYEEIVGSDPRYQVFSNALQQLRSSWCFAHFTYSRSNAHCLLTPLSPCFDRLSKSVLCNILQENFIRTSKIEEVFDDNNVIVLFVLSLEEIFPFFEKEYYSISNSQEGSSSFHSFNVNGKVRKVCLVEVSSLNVDWEEIAEKHRHNKIGFIAIYGDANSFKFIEASLYKLYNIFFSNTRLKDNVRESTTIYEYDTVSLCQHSTAPSSCNINNIVIVFCLIPHIVDDYRTFIARLDEGSFFQESMLGRLLEQGRILSSKYNGKLIEPYLDEIVQQKNVSPLHEFQISDSLKFLVETIFDENNKLYLSHKREKITKIVICYMCGDDYPLEIIMGLIFYKRMFEYSFRNETVYLQYKSHTRNSTMLVSIKMVSFHSAYSLISKENFHGCICVYSMQREASYQVLHSFVSNSNINLYHLIGIKGFSSNSSIYIQKTFARETLLHETKATIESSSDSDIIHNTNPDYQHNVLNQFLEKCYSEASANASSTTSNDLKSAHFDLYGDDAFKYSTLQHSKKKAGFLSKIISKADKESFNASSVRIKPKRSEVDWAFNPAFSPDEFKSTDAFTRGDQIGHNEDSKALSSEITAGKKASHLSKRQSRKKNPLMNLKFATVRFFDKIGESKPESNSSVSKGNSEPLQYLPMETNISSQSTSVKSSKKTGTYNIINSLRGRKKATEKNHQQKMLDWENLKQANAQSKVSSYFGKLLSNLQLFDQVPLFVYKCITYIEENGLLVEGIYRLSGNKQDVESLKTAFDADPNIDFSVLGYGIHVISSALKSFFNMLPSPLIPENLNEQILAATVIPNYNERQEKLKKIIEIFPSPNVETLAFLMHHLSRLSTQREKNKMDARNLAVCFWPTLIKDSFTTVGVFNGCTVHYCLFVHTLIENCQSLFGDPPSITSIKNKLTSIIERDGDQRDFNSTTLTSGTQSVTC